MRRQFAGVISVDRLMKEQWPLIQPFDARSRAAILSEEGCTGALICLCPPPLENRFVALSIARDSALTVRITRDCCLTFIAASDLFFDDQKRWTDNRVSYRVLRKIILIDSQLNNFTVRYRPRWRAKRSSYFLRGVLISRALAPIRDRLEMSLATDLFFSAFQTA